MTAPDPVERRPDRKEIVDAVLELFARRWPKHFPPAFRAEDIGVWTMALQGIPTDLLVPAAKRYLALEATRFVPAPKEVAQFARQLVEKHTDVTRTHTPFTPRRFWFNIDGRELVATEASGGGWIGVSESQLQQLKAGTGTWGWL
jgi:hypothetical protein